MRDMGILVTFVSAFILRSDLVRQVPNREQYIGTFFMQSHIALRTLAEEGLYLFLTKNCVAATGNSIVNYDLYYVWGEQYANLLFKTAIEAGMDRQNILELYEQDLYTVLYGFVKDFRRNCPESRKWKKSCILDRVKPYPKLYIRYLIVMYLPVKVVNGITSISKSIKKLIKHK